VILERINIGMAGILLACLCLGFAGFAQADAFDEAGLAPFETEDLGDGLYAFRMGRQRSIFLVGSDGVIATDPLNPEAAAFYRTAIEKITDQPIKFVVYTSSFFNRAAGGQALRDEGTRFVAHENCAVNLEATPHPHVVEPDETYSGTHELSAGDVSLELFYFGQSYGTCLSVMIARPANVMFVMNLVNPPAARVPEDPTLANYYLHNILPFFTAVESLAAAYGVKRVVGSIAKLETDGDELAPAVGPVTLISEQRVFWETVFGIVEAEYDKGTPARVIPKRADMTPLAGYPGYDPRHVEIMMRRIYSLFRIGR
jgi:hypothetical protein